MLAILQELVGLLDADGDASTLMNPPLCAVIYLSWVEILMCFSLCGFYWKFNILFSGESILKIG